MYRTGLLIGGALLAATVVPSGTGQAEHGSVDASVNEVFKHLQAFQDIANDNDGTRYASTPGYNASVDYVVDKLEDVGYDVTIQEFEYLASYLTADPVLEQTTPNAEVYEYAVDYFDMSYSGSGMPTAPAIAFDLDLGPDNTSTSGCEDADFASAPATEYIAILQRGACSFQLKAVNAEANGAVGVIVFNQGNTDDRKVLFGGTLGEDYTGTIPVVSMTYDLGVELSQTADVELKMDIQAFTGIETSKNVIAETSAGNPNQVVMLGAHLDSVLEGPGIQDNGSGSAAILQVALEMADQPTVNRVRFAWWGAEESGLIGSDYYVANLKKNELNKLGAYLNFDMIASPNFFYGVYDGDGSDFDLAGPGGSEKIEAFFENYYADHEIPSRGTEISFRSDYAAFFDNGIPFGGLFTGAESIKTDDDVGLWGGTAGEQYDPCYHAACDTIDNVSREAMTVNYAAVAQSAEYFGNYGAAISGLRGKGNENSTRSMVEASIDSHGHVHGSRSGN